MSRMLFCLLGLLCLAVTAHAAKVKLSPDNWGHEAGKDCVSCHTKSSSGLTAQWKESAHAEAGVNCMDCHQASPDDIDAIILYDDQTASQDQNPVICYIDTGTGFGLTPNNTVIEIEWNASGIFTIGA